jgi:hypothetical protein
MTDHRSFTLDDLLPSSWDRKIVLGIVDELASLPGEKLSNIDEIRRVLTLKSYRELFHRLEAASENKFSYSTVRSMAREIRQFGLERPALFAAALRKPQGSECREACDQMYGVLIQGFAQCGVDGHAASEAIEILQSLARGFVLNELLNGSLSGYSYEYSYENAIDLFIAGLPALLSPDHSKR